MIFTEDLDIRTSEVFRAILCGLNELSEERTALVELVNQLLEWRRLQQDIKKDRESNACKV